MACKRDLEATLHTKDDIVIIKVSPVFGRSSYGALRQILFAAAHPMEMAGTARGLV